MLFIVKIRYIRDFDFRFNFLKWYVTLVIYCFFNFKFVFFFLFVIFGLGFYKLYFSIFFLVGFSLGFRGGFVGRRGGEEESFSFFRFF